MNFKRYHESKNLWSNNSAWSNGSTDTRSYFRFSIRYYSGSAIAGEQFFKIESDGFSYFSITPQQNATQIQIKHDGSTRDLLIGSVYGNFTAGVPITVSFDVNGYDPTTVGGISISNIMFNTGSQPLPYEPYSSEVWHDTPHYIMGTSTDTLTTLPAVLYPNDTTATVGLKGNISQTGTPTPTTPIQPSECGERTANLTTLTEVTHDGYVKILSPTDSHLFDNIEYDTEYTLSWEITSTSTSAVYNQIRFLRSNSTSVKEINNGDSFTLTSTEMSEIVSIALYFGRTNTNGRMYNFMLNTGSTPQPYEPYGVKIPILLNSQTINKYLGEEQTTRQIKKLVLTGEEKWSITGSSGHSWIITIRDFLPPASSGVKGLIISSHYETINFNQSYAGNKTGISETATENEINICDTSISSTSDFKAYLAQQYAAGTPVTVWYVLATPETDTINEPLMKIGDYADSLTTSIPVTAGENTLDVQTTVQPSEVTANYRGWHPVSGVHEHDSNYTIATMQALTIAQLQTHTISDLQGGEWS